MITTYKTITPAKLPRPKYLTPVLEPGYLSTIMRVCANGVGGTPSTSIEVPSPVGGTWYGPWSRHRYSKRQPWNSTGEYLLIDQKYSGDPKRFVLKTTGANAYRECLFGNRIKSGGALIAGSPAYKLNRAREVQWRPNYPTQMVSYRQITSPFQGIEIEVWDVLTGATVGEVIQVSCAPYTIAASDLGWIGEGQISDDGRWTVVGTHLLDPMDNSGNDDFFVVVDLLSGIKGGATDISALTNAIDTSDRGNVGNYGISPWGNYVEVKMSGDSSGRQPSYIFDVDKASIEASEAEPCTIHVMQLDALRMGDADAHGAVGKDRGQISDLSHPCFNVNTANKEVVVGGIRNSDLSNADLSAYPSLGSGTDAQKRARIGKFYGHGIMIDLATGRHVHVTPGSKTPGVPTTDGEVSNVQHTSGMAYRRRKWHCITTEMETTNSAGETSPRCFDNELWMVHLNHLNTPGGSRNIERWCNLRTNDSTQGHSGSTTSSKYNSEAQACPNPAGTQIIYASNWMRYNGTYAGGERGAGPSDIDVKSYICQKMTVATTLASDRGGSGTTIYPALSDLSTP